MKKESRETFALTSEESAVLEKLIGELRPGLVLYLNGIVKNYDTAEDLAEDCFVILMQKKPSFPDERARKAWLFTVARHLAVNHLKREARMIPAGDRDDLPETPGEGTEEMLLRKEFWEEMYLAMQRLKREYMQVLWLSSGEDLSAAEIGRIMGITRRQAESLLYRARKALRREMEDDKEERK